MASAKNKGRMPSIWSVTSLLCISKGERHEGESEGLSSPRLVGMARMLFLARHFASAREIDAREREEFEL